MQRFHRDRLSASQRPILWEENDEHEIAAQTDVALYENSEKIAECQKGVVFVTTHRLIWQDMRHSAKHCLYLPLSDISALDINPVRYVSLRQSPKIGVTLSGGDAYIRLSFRERGRDHIFQTLAKAMKMQAWKVQPKSDGPVASSCSGNRVVGVKGLEDRMREKSEQRGATLQEGFKDLENLMVKAKEMVAIANKISSQVNKEVGVESDDDLRSFMLSMGIDNPVTKKRAGNHYHTQLAREVASFSEKVLPSQAGDMIALPDLYCLINRARGTSLISPDDLYRSCMLLDELNLPVVLRRFDSGVIVVQSRGHDDQSVSERMSKVVQEHGKVSAFDVANMQSISLSVATEQLETAERLGLLCRDESTQGIFFYENLFLRR